MCLEGKLRQESHLSPSVLTHMREGQRERERERDAKGDPSQFPPNEVKNSVKKKYVLGCHELYRKRLPLTP